MSRISFVVRLLFAALISFIIFPAFALTAASGKVILTVSGQVAATNSPAGAEFDKAMLEGLPQQTFTTKTPWDKDPVTFKGPLLRDVLAAAKATGRQIKALALNDYQTAIPLDDANAYGMIVAMEINGQAISVRTKGPLFIVYPFDAKPELQSTLYYERSAWQLRHLRVE